MGVLVQVKNTYSDILLPPLNLPFDAGQTQTLTDKEFAALSIETRTALVALVTGLADPIRVGGPAEPTSLDDAVRIAKTYTDSAVGSIVIPDPTPIPQNLVKAYAWQPNTAYGPLTIVVYNNLAYLTLTGVAASATFNASSWIALGGAGPNLTLVDNGDGTFTISGPGFADNGDGTFSLSSGFTDNGDGTFSIP